MAKKISQDIRQKAHDLYVKSQAQQKDIAQLLGITPTCLSSWITRYGWDKEKASLAISTDTLIPKILQQINDKIDDGSLTADSMAKYCKQLRELKKNELSINDHYQVMVKFIDSLRFQAATNKKITAELIQIVISAQDDFLKNI